MTECQANARIFDELSELFDGLNDECIQVLGSGVLDTGRQPRLTAVVRWWQECGSTARSFVRHLTADGPFGRFVMELDRLSDALNVEG